MSTVKIVAKFTFDAAFKEEVANIIKRCATFSRAEAGNIFYDLYESRSNVNALLLIEEWKSQEAIAFHNSTPHFQELIAGLAGKAQIDIDVLTPIL